MRNINCVVLSNTDTASHNGAAIDANQLVSASFQAVFGDSGVSGTVKVQASNDIYNARYNFPEGNFVPTNWTDIPNASASITSGGSALITIAQMSYRWIRVVFTYTTGGSSTIVVNMDALSV
jgi:hypothetical protein